jgi:hypothetical protein
VTYKSPAAKFIAETIRDNKLTVGLFASLQRSDPIPYDAFVFPVVFLT